MRNRRMSLEEEEDVIGVDSFGVFAMKERREMKR